MLKKSLFLILGIFVAGFATAQINPKTKTSLRLLKPTPEATELSFGLGTRFLTGDVITNPGIDFSLEIRRSFDHVFSVRAGVNYFPANEFLQVSRDASKSRDARIDIPNTGVGDKIISEGTQGNLELVVALNQLSNRKRRKVSVYSFFGAGAILSSLKLEQSAGNNTIDLGERIGLNHQFLTVCINAGIGVGYNISDRVSLYLEHKSSYMFGSTSADIHDGFAFSTVSERSSLTDFYHINRLKIAYNLGKMPKRSIPFWWTSPFEMVRDELNAIKMRPEMNYTDSDKDGVLDIFDLELYSDPNAIVDTRGVTMDSDQDGVVDHLDLEPFSPIGYPIDENGVADLRKPTFLKKDLEEKLKDDLKDVKPSYQASWFLPIIQFNNNISTIPQVEYTKIKQIATVLLSNPQLDVFVKGMAQNNTCSNSKLAYDRAAAVRQKLIGTYGISASRIQVSYGLDQDMSNIPNPPSYILNRVEVLISSNQVAKTDPGPCPK